jgi:hypothetical protein
MNWGGRGSLYRPGAVYAGSFAFGRIRHRCQRRDHQLANINKIARGAALNQSIHFRSGVLSERFDPYS